MNVGELAAVLRGARASLSAARGADAFGQPAATEAYRRMMDGWLAELDAHLVALRQVSDRQRGLDG